MRVLLVEPYADGSHRAWAEGYRDASGHRVDLLTMPGRSWRWRLRGSAVTLAGRVDAHVARHGRPDVALVSGLTDLAALAGIARRSLAGVPLALYLHESQVALGAEAGRTVDAEAALAQWRSMVAADLVLVASEHHRRALGEHLPPFLDRVAPDEGHRSQVAEVLARVEVLPVGVDLSELLAGERRTRRPGAPPLVVWNHRWDVDKAPEALVRVLTALARAGVAFEVALAGLDAWDDGRRRQAAEALGDRVVVAEALPTAAYRRLLLEADVAVSVARHEFFGVAAVEAMAAGAVTLLPDRLSYPELVPPELGPAVLYRSGLFDRLAAVLADLPAARRDQHGLRTAMAVHDWSVVAPRYDTRLATLTSR